MPRVSHFVLVILAGAFSVNAAAQQLPDMRSQKAARRSDTRLDDQLAQLVERAQTIPAAQAARSIPMSVRDAVPVSIRFDVGGASIESSLSQLGIATTNKADGVIEAYVPVDLLTQVAALDPVRKVSAIVPPLGRVTSQGVSVHVANTWQAGGQTGSGVKVGIIDVGFQGLLSLLGAELPASVTARCYTGLGSFSASPSACDAQTVHGTAVAETIFDVAPGVQLYLANPLSPLDLRNTVEWMTSQGVQIINHSVAWTWDGPGDGTSPFSDAPLSSVDLAVSGGAMWANAAGNEARATWTGAAADSDNDGWLEFQTGPQCPAGGCELNGLAYSLQESLHVGQQFVAQARWEDSWTDANRDLDLYLFQLNTTSNVLTIVAQSENIQSGLNGQVPLESLVLYACCELRLYLLSGNQSFLRRVARLGSTSSVYVRNDAVPNGRPKHREPSRERQSGTSRGWRRPVVRHEHDRVFQQSWTDDRRPDQTGRCWRRSGKHRDLRRLLTVDGRIRWNQPGVSACRRTRRARAWRISQHAPDATGCVSQSHSIASQSCEYLGRRVRTSTGLSFHDQRVGVPVRQDVPGSRESADHMARLRHRRQWSIRIPVLGVRRRQLDPRARVLSEQHIHLDSAGSRNVLTSSVGSSHWIHAAFEDWKSSGFFSVTGAPAVAVTSLTSNVAFPVSFGTPITWTATATGGTALLQYQFWRLRQGVGWTMVQDYSPNNTFTWTPGVSEGGTYSLQVWVKSAGSTATFEAWRGSDNFAVTGPAAVTVTSFTTSVPLPAPVFSPITWTATATGGVGPLLYQFWRLRQGVGWTMVQDYSTLNTFSWTPVEADAGSYVLQVWVKSSLSSAAFDAWSSTGNFQISLPGPVQITSLASSVMFPATVGTPITLSAMATGGSPPVQFKFWLRDGSGAWSVLQDYSPVSNVTWTPTQAGNYIVQVWARSNGSMADFEDWRGMATITISPVVPMVSSLTSIVGLPAIVTDSLRPRMQTSRKATFRMPSRWVSISL